MKEGICLQRCPLPNPLPRLGNTGSSSALSTPSPQLALLAMPPMPHRTAPQLTSSARSQFSSHFPRKPSGPPRWCQVSSPRRVPRAPLAHPSHSTHPAFHNCLLTCPSLTGISTSWRRAQFERVSAFSPVSGTVSGTQNTFWMHKWIGLKIRCWLQETCSRHLNVALKMLSAGRVPTRAAFKRQIPGLHTHSPSHLCEH